jgi:hypothetical protein
MSFHRFAAVLLVLGAGAVKAHQRLATGQWTWNNKPLYLFAGDAQPVDKAGDGSGSVWHIVRPSGTVTGAAAAPLRIY